MCIKRKRVALSGSRLSINSLSTRSVSILKESSSNLESRSKKSKRRPLGDGKLSRTRKRLKNLSVAREFWRSAFFKKKLCYSLWRVGPPLGFKLSILPNSSQWAWHFLWSLFALQRAHTSPLKARHFPRPFKSASPVVGMYGYASVLPIS